MKNSILTIAAISLLAGALIMGCSTSAQKVENAQGNVTQAEKNLDEANQVYLADIENYRREAAAKIEVNNQSIADFNSRMESQKAEAREDYKKKIAVIEQKNSDMKKKLDDYKAKGKVQWEKFKTEFGRDMDELGIAFKNIATPSNK